MNRVGTWWGPAIYDLCQSGDRRPEEIDIVDLRARRVVLMGEVRRPTDPMDLGALGDPERFELPALAKVPGVKVMARSMIVPVSLDGIVGPVPNGTM